MACSTEKKDWIALARQVLDIESEGILAVRDQIDGGFTEALGIMGACKGRVVVTGIGKSGLVGRKIAATLSSTGTASYFLHPVEGAHGDMGMIRHDDVVLAISNSGETDELNSILPTLRSLGARIIALTGGLDSTMSSLSHVTIPCSVPREACPMGLAPTASTTASLAIGDALAVCLMNMKSFGEKDFAQVHPAGALGQRLGRKVEELMHVEDLPVASEGTSMHEALDILNQGGLGLLAILNDSGVLTGVLTDGDVRRLVCEGPVNREAPVDISMTRGPRRALPDEKAACVLDEMEARQITVLPVVDEADRLLGMIHLHDLLGKGRLKFSR